MMPRKKQQPKDHQLIKGKKFILVRPIAFIDLETTSADAASAKIVEISVLVHYPDGTEETRTKRVNPGIPIPDEASLVHGITDDDVKNEPLFIRYAKGLHELIKDCDIAGFNINTFDAPILYREFRDAGVTWEYRKSNIIDVRTIYTINEPRTLSAAYKFYTGKDLEGAHGSEADIKGTRDVLISQLGRYDLPGDLKELALYSNYGRQILDISGKFTLDAEGDVIFAFGQHVGKKAKNHRPYLEWMIKGNFNPDTKGIATAVFYNKQIATA